ALEGKRRGEKKKEVVVHWKSGGRSARRGRAGGGIVDSCQMLIKAKERKTLVSPAKGVASQEMTGLSAPPSDYTTTIVAPPLDTPGRACARIFILRELRRSRLLLRLALGHRLVYDDGRNIKDDDYGACNPFNVATLLT
ncbi:hypothetical protein ALC62_12928, partial [Cyphomyrmex costatus]